MEVKSPTAGLQYNRAERRLSFWIKYPMNTTQTAMATPFELDERGVLLTCPQCSKRNRLRYEALK